LFWKQIIILLLQLISTGIRPFFWTFVATAMQRVAFNHQKASHFRKKRSPEYSITLLNMLRFYQEGIAELLLKVFVEDVRQTAGLVPSQIRSSSTVEVVQRSILWRPLLNQRPAENSEPFLFQSD
jgi:hypothetical protein